MSSKRSNQAELTARNSLVINRTAANKYKKSATLKTGHDSRMRRKQTASTSCFEIPFAHRKTVKNNGQMPKSQPFFPGVFDEPQSIRNMSVRALAMKDFIF